MKIVVVNGFVDSGKTTMLYHLIDHSENDTKKLFISCEQDDIGYDMNFFKKKNCELIYFNSFEEINKDNFKQLFEEYGAEEVFIEYTSRWSIEKIVECFELVNIVTTIDGSEFKLDFKNMSQQVQDVLYCAQTVVVNRYDYNTLPKVETRNILRYYAPYANVIFMDNDRNIDLSVDNSLFDSASIDIFEITDDLYFDWYIDCVENPIKYTDDLIHLQGEVNKADELKLRDGIFFIGRTLMTCCNQDIAYLGLKCKYDKADEINHGDFVDIIAEVKEEFSMEYKVKGAVLYIKEIKKLDTNALPNVYIPWQNINK